MPSASTIQRVHEAKPENQAIVCQKAEEELRVTGYIALRDIRCELHHGVLRIRGRLRSQYLKQVAQAVVARVAGKIQLENHIEIIGQPPRPRGIAVFTVGSASDGELA